MGAFWGLLFSFPVPCLTLVLGRHHPYKSLERGGSDSRIGEYFGQLAAHIPLGYGDSRGSHRIVLLPKRVRWRCWQSMFYVKWTKRLYGLSWSFDKGVLLHVFRVSVWSMFHSFIGVAPWFLFFVAIEHLGELQLAVANILRSISTLFFVIVNSFAATTGSLVSNLIGADERGQVFPLCSRVIRLGYAIGFPLIALALIFHQSVIDVYTDNPVIVQTSWLPFVVMLLNYVFALPGYVYMNAVTGTGATRTAFILQATTIAAYLLYLWGLSHCDVPLAVYWTVEYLFVIGLGVQSVIYLKHKHY